MYHVDEEEEQYRRILTKYAAWNSAVPHHSREVRFERHRSGMWIKRDLESFMKPQAAR